MMGLLDMGLLALDVAAWNTDRQKCLQPIVAMAVHREWLLRYRVGIMWSDDFFGGFPWNQATVPPELNDYCISLMQFHSQMQANSLLVLPDQTPGSELPIVIPDPVAEPHVSPFRELWLQLFASLVCHPEASQNGVAVPTWEQSGVTPGQELVVQNAANVNAFVGRVPLLRVKRTGKRSLGNFINPI